MEIHFFNYCTGYSLLIKYNDRPAESLRLPEKSPLCEDYTRSPWGVLGESLESGKTSVMLGLLPKESLGTPWGLPSNVWLSVTKLQSPTFSFLWSADFGKQIYQVRS